MSTLQATGPSILRIGFDPAAFAKLLPDQQQEFVRWYVARVLKGETSAVEEWERLGLKVDLRPWQR
ncbi:hypothetical protein [Sphingomonas sp. LHG3406-1]|uniref:hypothetical protein n=1 Tax=Sphingomonas sp. LHG3406-1 TaxID=2804617 RepID=UPI00262B15AE|nr:hypothetical protein [Sphingomonas sp. LHG3406-1]